MSTYLGGNKTLVFLTFFFLFKVSVKLDIFDLITLVFQRCKKWILRLYTPAPISRWSP